ncbi:MULTISPECIES: TetR/AcrR family transcriptional regulator [Nocardiopsis]|uniref:TetR/AcrR family transcriptional regulator n=1 Tax=Nocardiopsis lambiniae TaxID=3075539 RepID=A0ABU2MGL3_9ACTN|nr:MULTISPECIES: TetR/AcrR family transcriptional regulator [unclassified Nocardiopsis]MDE3722843.1 TetR/AcrR family transcriptional regulator [Nocardiopsis sp. N85]MDT0331845.1 TetR/AcrR family transcriptional regulator [Nocardiopsis sp. DSM 44743]
MTTDHLPETTPRRGRPRDAARDRALMDATLTELQLHGYGGLTTAAVARRAGVSTATLYRRWRSKEHLVIGAAGVWAEDLGPDRDTGGLRSDLRTLLHDKATALDGPSGRLLRAILGEAAHNRALADVLTQEYVAPLQDRVATLLTRAVARGEIPPVEDPVVVGELVIGPMITHTFLIPHTPDSRPGAEVAERLLPYLLRALGARTE